MSFEPELAAIVAMAAAALSIFSGCVSSREAMRSMDLSVLILVASALGVSRALDSSGAAEWLAGQLLTIVQPLRPAGGPGGDRPAHGTADGAAEQQRLRRPDGDARHRHGPRHGARSPAASAGRGRHLVLRVRDADRVPDESDGPEPGGYKFSDYLKIGIPLDLICWILTVILIPCFLVAHAATVGSPDRRAIRSK